MLPVLKGSAMLRFRSVNSFTHDMRCSAALAVARCPSVSVCLSQVGVLPKRMNGSSWFVAWKLLSTYPIIHGVL